MTPVELAVERVEAIHASDARGTAFEVDVHADGDDVVMTGIVADDHVRSALGGALQDLPGVARVEDELRTLAELGEPMTATAAVSSVRDAPDADAEQVNQVLYAADVEAYDGRGDWRRVRVPDGYVGWVEDRHLGAVSTEGSADEPWRPNAVLSEAKLDIEAVAERTPDPGLPPDLYAGTDCRVETVEGGVAEVSFRTGGRTQLPPSAIRTLEVEGPTQAIAGGAEITQMARRFLGTDYVWGGMTREGIDCSGLIWIAFRCTGITLPRDSDQQERVGRRVGRVDLSPGDLLFFPGHVAMSLGGDEYIHAYGEAGGVTVNSLDPDDADYLAELDESLRSMKRVLA